MRGYTKSAGGSRFYIIRKQRGFILYYKIKKIGGVDFVIGEIRSLDLKLFHYSIYLSVDTF